MIITLHRLGAKMDETLENVEDWSLSEGCLVVYFEDSSIRGFNVKTVEEFEIEED